MSRAPPRVAPPAAAFGPGRTRTSTDGETSAHRTQAPGTILKALDQSGRGRGYRVHPDPPSVNRKYPAEIRSPCLAKSRLTTQEQCNE